MTTKHILKTDPEPFQAVKRGDKTHEIRFNDRNFQLGDFLVLQETNFSAAEAKERNVPLELTGDVAVTWITHIQEGYGLMPGWVILSLSRG